MADSKNPPEQHEQDGHERNHQLVKVYSVPTLVRMVHRVVQKSCRRVRQLFYCSMNSLLCDRLAICPAQKEEGHTEEQHSAVCDAAAAALTPPSTILILNISNSTLIDCVIGSETCPPTVAEQQPLMHRAVQDLHETDSNRNSWSPPSIHIDRSNLSCVIFGDNNYMKVDQTLPSEDCEEF